MACYPPPPHYSNIITIQGDFKRVTVFWLCALFYLLGVIMQSVRVLMLWCSLFFSSSVDTEWWTGCWNPQANFGDFRLSGGGSNNIRGVSGGDDDCTATAVWAPAAWTHPCLRGCQTQQTRSKSWCSLFMHLKSPSPSWWFGLLGSFSWEIVLLRTLCCGYSYCHSAAIEAWC